MVSQRSLGHEMRKFMKLNSLFQAALIHQRISTAFTAKNEPTRETVSTLENLKDMNMNAKRKESVLFQSMCFEYKDTEKIWTITYDHISKAYGKEYKIARVSNPCVLCVLDPKNCAYIEMRIGDDLMNELN